MRLNRRAPVFRQRAVLAGHALVFAGGDFRGFDALRGLRAGNIGVAGHHANGADLHGIGGDIGRVGLRTDPIGGAAHAAISPGGHRFDATRRGDNGGQRLRAIHRATRRIDRQDDGLHGRIRQCLFEVSPDQLGTRHAGNLRHQVGALGQHAADRNDGHAITDFVGLLLVGQRSTETLLDRFNVDFFAAHVRGVNRLNLQQLFGGNRPRRGNNIKQFHGMALNELPSAYFFVCLMFRQNVRRDCY